MGHLDEITVALESVNNSNNVWLSLIIKDKNHLLSGHDIAHVYALAKNKNVDCLIAEL